MANLLIDLDLIFILLQIFPTRFFEDSGYSSWVRFGTHIVYIYTASLARKK
jgi:hypothetical protein